MRVIILQAWWVLVGSLSEVVLVCKSVRYGFTIEIYGFTHTFWHVLLMYVMSLEIEDSEDRSKVSPDIDIKPYRKVILTMVQRYKRLLTTQQEDER